MNIIHFVIMVRSRLHTIVSARKCRWLAFVPFKEGSFNVSRSYGYKRPFVDYVIDVDPIAVAWYQDLL